MGNIEPGKAVTATSRSHPSSDSQPTSRVPIMACSGRQQDQVLAQKQLATSSNQTATFFGLHAEVRNAIYKELFRDTELRETNRYRATWSHGFVPSSLLTCRRFYQEALAVLAACITLVFNGPTFGSDHIPIIFLRRIRRLDILVPRPSKRFLQEQLSRLPDLRVLLLAGLTVWLDGTQEDLVTLPFRLSHLGEKVIMSAMVAYMAYFDARLRERVKRKNSDLKVFLRVQLELLPTKRSQNQIEATIDIMEGKLVRRSIATRISSDE